MRALISVTLLAGASLAAWSAATERVPSGPPRPPGRVPPLVTPCRVVPPAASRPRFYTDMPMDLVRVIAPDQRARSDRLPPMPRAEIEIIAPNARVREYETQMPIFPPVPLRRPPLFKVAPPSPGAPPRAR